jgi:hypothetical protein
MKYFVPDIRISGELEPQAAPEDKFGGLPWGLDAGSWPKCSACGKSQSLLAQLLHHPSRLDLGREGRVLHVFQCNHDPGACSTWEGGSGANACFVVEPERIGAGLTQIPGDKPPVDSEVRVVRWIERDGEVTTSTRLGGVPYWIQSPDEAPQGDWRFVGQLDSTHSFLQAPKRPAAWVHEDKERLEGRAHYGDGPNFGDMGIAYLFVKTGDPSPQGWFFWQCS